MSKPERRFAIVIPLPKSLQVLILDTQKEFKARFGIHNILDKTAGPHITLLQDFQKKEEALKIANSLSMKEKFKIQFNSFGVYTLDSPLVFIRWQVNETMSKIIKELVQNSNKENIPFFFHGFNFLAKTTLAFGDTKTSQISEYLELLNKMINIKEFEPEELAVYSYDEKEELIAQIPL